MLVPLILFVAAAGYASGSLQASQYLDNVINTALQNEIRAQALDPSAIQNFSTEFVDKVAIIGKVKGKADYDKGVLTGLSKVRRFNDCQGPSYSFGYRTINCTLKFDDLKIVYEGKVKYGKMPKVSVKGKANVTSTLIYVEVTSLNQSPATLRNFRYSTIGRLNIKFTGLGPLNKFTKFLEDGYRSHVEAQVLNSVSQRFQNALNRAVAMVPMPM